MMDFHPETPKGCPPKDALPSNGAFYRVVYHNPPIADDFVIWVMEERNQRKLATRKKKRDCCAFAVSLSSTEEDVRRLCRLFQHARSKKAEVNKQSFMGYAHIQLDANSGVLKQLSSNPAHHELWPYVTSKLECKVISVRSI